MVQEMVRDCTHTRGDGQSLQAWYRRWSETADMIQEMVRDADMIQRWSKTSDIIQEMVRDCGHGTGYDQRL
ncbi:unnamed protein product [Staurois parvus]|uniref:Uncharacterized protein n=1 Tax=Staurois parvus TaxID=386267 RepID=A0ABN9GLS6_9NEOB|nr:unnamed protein product [Staurois parvus]